MSRVYQQGNGNFWLAFAGVTVVGTVALIDIGNGQGALRKMFVKPEYRGGSYRTGQRLLQQLLQWAQERDMCDVFLGTTEKFTAAHRFYEKNGFIQVAQTQLPPTFPLMRVDSRFYHLALTTAINAR